MAKNFDWLGDHAGSFSKESPLVSNDLSGNLQVVGKTQNEKTFAPNFENVEWFDNTGSTQILFKLDIDKVDPTMTFSFMQVTDTNVMPLALNMDMDTSGSDQDFHFLGSEPDAYSEGEWRFSWKSTDSRDIVLIFRRAIGFSSGDVTLGTPGSYTEVPITIRALQDTTIANTKRDLIYFVIDKRAFS